ncbi:hypothetical protein OROMI_024109 [Orobanche minor]
MGGGICLERRGCFGGEGGSGGDREEDERQEDSRNCGEMVGRDPRSGAEVILLSIRGDPTGSVRGGFRVGQGEEAGDTVN